MVACQCGGVILIINSDTHSSHPVWDSFVSVQSHISVDHQRVQLGNATTTTAATTTKYECGCFILFSLRLSPKHTNKSVSHKPYYQESVKQTLYTQDVYIMQASKFKPLPSSAQLECPSSFFFFFLDFFIFLPAADLLPESFSSESTCIRSCDIFLASLCHLLTDLVISFTLSIVAVVLEFVLARDSSMP